MADGPMADDTLDRLCRRFALDAEAVRAAVATAAGPDTPCYLRAATGFGAWLTSGAMILAVGFALAQAFGDDRLPTTAAGFGVILAVGAVVLHRAGGGAFAGQFAVATALAAQVLIAGGVGGEVESLGVMAAVAAAVAGVLAAGLRDPEHQFLAAGFAVGIVPWALLENEVPHADGLLILATLPPAVALLVRPPARVDLRGLALALLLVPLASLTVSGLLEVGDEVDRLPSAVYAVGLLAVLGLLWRAAAPDRRPLVLVGGAVAVGLGAITAAGVLGSLLLLTLAYLLGSRMLAALGAVAHVWFVWRFYYDLELTLLEKSGTLAAAGLLLLALWWAWSRIAPKVEAADG